MTFPEIEKETRVKANTAEKIYRQKDNGYNGKSAVRSGRPPKLNKIACKNIQSYIVCNRHTQRESLKDITKKLNLNGHPNTLHKTLIEISLRHRIERKQPWLSDKQKEARLAFALKYTTWTKEDWKYVEFSDEMSLQTGSNQGNIYVWRYPEEKYKEDCCASTHKSGFKKIKV